MSTRIDEIADGIYRLSTFVPAIGPAGMTFNQFLLRADEPLLFHTGPRGMFPSVCAAIEQVMPVAELRHLSFGHVESDECGAMNDFLRAAPEATVAVGGTACMVSVNDLADRAPRPLGDGEVLDLGGRRVRYLATPHLPHNWEAGLLFEETTRTLLCGDLFTHLGDGPPVITDDILGPAVQAELAFRYSSRAPGSADTIRRLADLEPTCLALMHGSSFEGDAARALRALATAYDEGFGAGS